VRSSGNRCERQIESTLNHRIVAEPREIAGSMSSSDCPTNSLVEGVLDQTVMPYNAQRKPRETLVYHLFTYAKYPRSGFTYLARGSGSHKAVPPSVEEPHLPRVTRSEVVPPYILLCVFNPTNVAKELRGGFVCYPKIIHLNIPPTHT
jgi:hypothetical protein